LSKSDSRKNNYAFIDSQNLNLAIRDLGWALDFKRFRIYLADKFIGCVEITAVSENTLNLRQYNGKRESLEKVRGKLVIVRKGTISYRGYLRYFGGTFYLDLFMDLL